MQDRQPGSKHSIRRKLTRIIMVTSTATALLVCLGFTVSGLANLRKRLVADLSMTAQIVGSNSSTALKNGDRIAAQKVLSSLRAKPSIVVAGIYSARGEPFARYEPYGSISIPNTILADGFHDAGDRFELFYGIRLDGERIGTFYIAADARDRNARLKQYGQIAAGIVLVALLVAFALSWWLQGSISEPIVELARIANLVSQHKDFSARASHPALNDSDEIGNLISGFNGMLAEIEQRDDRLLRYQTQLEQMVASSTAELIAANDELLIAKNDAEIISEINGRLHRETALILNSATDGIMGIDLDNRITFLNPAGSRILGLTMSDMKGTIHEAVHHSYADGRPWREADCAKTHSTQRGESVPLGNDTFWRTDGTSFPVEYASTPMMDEGGKQVGAVVIFRDVTERQAVERLKSEFVSTVSHELRTPLTSIRGALGLLASGLLGPIAETGQRMLEIAVSNTDRLVRLINDILDLERNQPGNVELARGPVDANTVMVQALEGVQSIADQAGVRLVLVSAAGSLWGDSDRILQTLTNLLGNAIKFSPADTAVTLSGTAHEADFAFCVADHGRGVPEQKLETIFERFQQVDSSDSRDKGGSGLGLAICKSIVIAHGGRIWAEKNDHAGSRFQFTIPLAVPAVALLPLESPSRALDPAFGELSVLVVENDLDLARVMVTALQARGLRTFHAASGNDALEHCRRHEPSLIILDLILADMDGFAVVDALRESRILSGIPLLVYSALDVGTTDQARLRLGPTEFLTKSRGSLLDFEEQVVRILEKFNASRLLQRRAS